MSTNKCQTTKACLNSAIHEHSQVKISKENIFLNLHDTYNGLVYVSIEKRKKIAG